MSNKDRSVQKKSQLSDVRSIEELLLAGRDIKRMEEGIKKLERFAKEIAKQGLPKRWNSTKELHKLRYGRHERS